MEYLKQINISKSVYKFIFRRVEAANTHGGPSVCQAPCPILTSVISSKPHNCYKRRRLNYNHEYVGGGLTTSSEVPELAGRRTGVEIHMTNSL